MYLHNDKDLFEEVINETNSRTGIAESIIEKDYYVTMILKQLSKLAPETVFKGGTALSKCFHMIYDTITKVLISDDVTYEQTALTLREIADKLF